MLGFNSFHVTEIPPLLDGIADDARQLVRQEVELAREKAMLRVSEAVAEAWSRSSGSVIGGLISFTAASVTLGLLGFSFAFYLYTGSFLQASPEEETRPLWLCFLFAALIMGLVASASALATRYSWSARQS